MIEQDRALLSAVTGTVRRAARAWMKQGASLRGDDTAGPILDEEAAAVSEVLSALRILAQPARGASGGPVTQLFPRSIADRLALPGHRITIEAPEPWLRAAGSERVLVVAAGNVSSLGPLDALHHIFLRGSTVVLKLHPVHASLRPIFRQAFAPLIDARRLVLEHDLSATFKTLIDAHRPTSLHLTGRQRTFVEARTHFEGPVIAELGGLSPLVIFPMALDAGALHYQVRHVTTLLTANGGLNCLTPRVLITARDWPQRTAFLTALGDSLRRVKSRPSWLPGVEAQQAELIERFVVPTTQRSPPQAGSVPFAWSFGHDPAALIDAIQADDFAPFTWEVGLEGPLKHFPEGAGALCDALPGNLCAMVLADDHAAGDALDFAHHLRFGTVGLNAWPALAHLHPVAPWGAAPAPAPSEGNGSGQGHTLGFSGLCGRRVILEGPLRWPFDPPWFFDHPMAGRLARPWLMANRARSLLSF